jgi:hypothetical protein
MKTVYVAGCNKASPGSLGGTAGANALCQQQANAVGRKERWRAFWSSSAQDVVALLTGTTAGVSPVFNLKNQKLYNN